MPSGSAPTVGTAAEYLAARQGQHPPKYQTAESWRALFGVALSLSPRELRAKAARGVITSGEVGELSPNACVTPIGRGYAIELYSGMMRLVYSAARAMCATDPGLFRSGEPAAAFSGAQAAAQIATLFKNYEADKIATAQVFPVTDEQRGWANAIAVHAETFLLMHELAHVYNEHSLWRPFGKIGAPLALEVRADSTAGRWLIDYLLRPTPGGPQRQMFYAGAEFGLRIRMAMETAGMHFGDTHPSAGDRIAALRARLRKFGGPQRFYAIANTSLAFDQMWRAIEQMLLDRPSIPVLTLDDILSSMRTMVVELLRGSDINDVIEIRQVAGHSGQLQAVLAPKEPTKQAMVESARECMEQVAPELRLDACAHAGDVFAPGAVEYSLLLALLNAVQG